VWAWPSPRGSSPGRAHRHIPCYIGLEPPDAPSRPAPETPGRTLQTARCGVPRPTGSGTASRRSYRQTLQHLASAIGDDRALGAVDGTTVEHAWGHCAPATWNRHVATVRSFVAFCRRHGWLVEDVAGGLDRRREPADRTKAIPRAELERLW
jgi:integrase